MAAPKTTMLRLKLRTTGEQVDAEIKLLPVMQIAAVFRNLGIKTASEFMRLGDLGDLKIIEFAENLSAEALSINEHWTASDVRTAFDMEEILKIFEALNQSVPQAPKSEGQTRKLPPSYHQ